MANHKSAEKRARQTERRTAVNTARRSRVRATQTGIEDDIEISPQDGAREMSAPQTAEEYR